MDHYPQDPQTPPSLTTVPEELTLKILDNCDYPTIAAVQKVNHSLRDFIHRTIPKCDIRKFQMRVQGYSIHLNLQLNENPLPYPKGGVLAITYEREGSATIVQDAKGERKRLLNMKLEQTVLNDVFAILKHQKGPMEGFEVIGDMMLSAIVLKWYYKRMEQDGSIPLIQTKELAITCTRHFEFDKLVPFMDPGVLRKIKLVGENDKASFYFIEKLMATDQWKQCQELEFTNLRISGGIDHILHFLKVTGTFFIFRRQNVIDLKQAFVRSQPSKHFRLYYSVLLGANQMQDILGPHFARAGERFKYHWFYTTINPNHVLHLMMYDNTVLGEEHLPGLLELKLITGSDVPVGALIQNGLAR